MHLFSYGIDPLLIYLEKRLKGPVLPNSLPLASYEERYKVIGYADDVKPAVTCMSEFTLIDRAMDLFERASGCKFHRNPASQKCKFLPLARWRGTLEQTDIPRPYMTLPDLL